MQTFYPVAGGPDFECPVGEHYSECPGFPNCNGCRQSVLGITADSSIPVASIGDENIVQVGGQDNAPSPEVVIGPDGYELI